MKKKLILEIAKELSSKYGKTIPERVEEIKAVLIMRKEEIKLAMEDEDKQSAEIDELLNYYYPGGEAFETGQPTDEY